MVEGYADFDIFSWLTAVSFPEDTNSVTCTIIIYIHTHYRIAFGLYNEVQMMYLIV